MTTGEDAYILVVDDEGAIRYSISKTLQRIGYQVLGYHIEKGGCEFCGRAIHGVWS